MIYLCRAGSTGERLDDVMLTEHATVGKAIRHRETLRRVGPAGARMARRCWVAGGAGVEWPSVTGDLPKSVRAVVVTPQRVAVAPPYPRERGQEDAIVEGER